MLLTDADQLREALAIALRERDEARAVCLELSGRLESSRRMLDDAHVEIERLRAELRTVAERERDEARAALVSLQEEYEIMRQDNERLRSNRQWPHNYVHKAFYEQMLERVAKRQREACAVTVEKNVDDLMLRKGLAEDVRDTPLVTEEKP